MAIAEVEPRLQQFNPALLEAINRVYAEKPKRSDPPLKLYLASYPYGALIVDRGRFRPPCDTARCGECAALVEECSYSHIPLGVVLSKSIEVFIDAHSAPGGSARDEPRAIPLRVLKDGDLFGVFETLHGLLNEVDSRPPWSVSSGARSIWVIAPLKDKRIADVLGVRCGRHVDWLHSQGHWRLVQQSMRRENWQSEVLFIGRGVIDRVRAHCAGTDKLFELILATGWRQSAALRNSATIEASLRQRYLDGPGNFLSSKFGDMYLFATVCHLFAISRGDAPAFEPAATARQGLGPFVAFERELHETLKTIKRERSTDGSSGNGKAEAHYPVVLQPTHLNENGDRGFYSFRCPSLPGLKLPRVTSYAEVTLPVKKTVEELAAENSNALDLGRSSYFTQSGLFDLHRPDSDFQWQEFLAHVSETRELYKRERLFVDSPFLVSGIRLVRGEPRHDIRHD